ncbi:DUF63 family protein [Halorhabdus sp. CBA1104]|uniref:DUF63 family protein n=1 Tax=unclassified Halorhabdus TaxID=2621901 RepID=UPI0012B3E6E1|nr:MULTISPECIES: DUF63 family protein [unclassified Halorhabdus]QGN06676.1 DUF63 family protein [Halorhabdus sp. CBA1104]
MNEFVKDNPGRAWLATFAVAVLAVAGGSLAFTKTVWDRFIWQYFWGPVYADAHNAACAIKAQGETTLVSWSNQAQCAIQGNAVVAEPGYTIVSEVGYMITAFFFVIGVFLLLRRLDLSLDRNMLYALVPFMLFGGALRVVEDATDEVPAGVDSFLSYPLNSLFISPVIYFTVFAIALTALLASVELADRDIVETTHKPLAAMGIGVLAVTTAYLGMLGLTAEYVGFYPQVIVLTVGLASLFAYGLYVLADRFAPEINRGTGYAGLVVLWGQAIDGVANVLMADWIHAIGLPEALTYSAKHPANAIIIDVTNTVLPPGVIDVIGTSWPFLLVKLAVPLGFVWLFTEEFVEESPRFSYLLLVAVTAVGLGPGTRDMVRAALAI